ncbi:exopolysaccharide biosynthesis protein [Halopseudomonas pelagia]|uniref:Exopolysaccharide biosynthesis protein n=1 Tax=Halopseudomonas pelagia TaxID=553151 RepID=A0AA91Z4L8_9GAMM|nr:exopolysaccharide biosynthesis protein [Halopseudomonas pelagia]PCC97953.1 exopolysaccharide biosynthesis protein [Halopseudomonas pelagia]QFY55952.1 exopolysaccharide biosynthesis protein [Halopseudomonas pelagia]
MSTSLHNLEQLLEHIAVLAKDEQQVSMAQVVESVGDRSFGPLLLIMGLTLFSPLSGVPGMAIFAGLFVLLIALQMLVGRKHFWLPGFILNRSVAQSKLTKALDWLKPTARRVDRMIKPRLNFMLHPSSTYLIAGLCVMVGAALPFLELVPFSSSIVGLALAILGLALVARDGLLVLIAVSFIGAAGSLAIIKLL